MTEAPNIGVPTRLQPRDIVYFGCCQAAFTSRVAVDLRDRRDIGNYPPRDNRFVAFRNDSRERRCDLPWYSNLRRDAKIEAPRLRKWQRRRTTRAGSRTSRAVVQRPPRRSPARRTTPGN